MLSPCHRIQTVPEPYPTHSHITNPFPSQHGFYNTDQGVRSFVCYAINFLPLYLHKSYCAEGDVCFKSKADNGW